MDEDESLSAAIEALYEAFGSVERPSEVFGCDCCVLPSQCEVLLSYPLRGLEAVDVQGYEWKAITTWGTEADFHYFFPRLFELALVEQRFEHWHLRNKLELAGWQRWPSSQRLAIRRCLLAQLEAAVVGPDRYGTFAGSVLEDASHYFDSVAPLVAIWEDSPGAKAVLTLAELIELNAAVIRTGEPELFPLFGRTESLRLEIAGWLGAPARLELLRRARLENDWTDEDARSLDGAARTLQELVNAPGMNRADSGPPAEAKPNPTPTVGLAREADGVTQDAGLSRHRTDWDKLLGRVKGLGRYRELGEAVGPLSTLLSALRGRSELERWEVVLSHAALSVGNRGSSVAVGIDVVGANRYRIYFIDYDDLSSWAAVELGCPQVVEELVGRLEAQAANDVPRP